MRNILKGIINLVIIISLVPLAGCNSLSVQEKLEGKWMMQKVLRHDQDVTAEHNPNSDRWIEFQNETFKSGGTPFGDNSGTWYLKSDGPVIFLDSNVENDDSEWRLSISRDTMQWTGIGDPGKEAFTLKFTKSNR